MSEFETDQPPSYEEIMHGPPAAVPSAPPLAMAPRGGGRGSAILDSSSEVAAAAGDLELPRARYAERYWRPDGASTLATVFLLVNAALGAGLLNFPRAFQAAGGIIAGVGVQAIMLVFVLIALLVLAHCADQDRADTLQATMASYCGVWGRRLTSICVAVYCFGTTVTFLIVIGDQFDRALVSLVGPHFCHIWYMDRSFTMPAASLLLILPLCFSKRIDFLRLPSMLGVLAIFYIVGLIVYEYFYGDFVPGEIKTHPDAWTDVFLVIPAICFGYQCHVSAIPIYSCMKERKRSHFFAASFSAIVICAVVYTSAAVFGYLTFGDKVAADIMLNYPAGRPEVLVAIIAMAVKTITSYPILLFCGREALRSLLREISCWGLCGQDNDQNSSDDDNLLLGGEEALIEQQLLAQDDPPPEVPGENQCVSRSCCCDTIERAAIASAWFVLSLAVAVFVPDIGAVIRMLGSLAAAFIFVLPGVGLFQLVQKSDPSLFRWKAKANTFLAFVFVGIGAFLIGVEFTQGLMQHLGHGVGPKPEPLCV